MKPMLGLSLTLLVWIAAVLPTRGEPFLPYGKHSWKPLGLWSSLLRSCGCSSDDYCPKPLPVVPCGPCGCVDDYCAKCLPAVPCRASWGWADDYSRKCCPIQVRPCCRLGER